jgi:septal ring factor EnvC (AmiA/AmiB activator)
VFSDGDEQNAAEATKTGTKQDQEQEPQEQEQEQEQERKHRSTHVPARMQATSLPGFAAMQPWCTPPVEFWNEKTCCSK